MLEAIPAELAKTISEQVAIPTIGIGAGPHCDGQVLVLYDLLGRVQHRGDMRDATVSQFMRRYHVDAAQAERVRNLALAIYDALNAGAERDRAEREPDDADARRPVVARGDDERVSARSLGDGDAA